MDYYFEPLNELCGVLSWSECVHVRHWKFENPPGEVLGVPVSRR